MRDRRIKRWAISNQFLFSAKPDLIVPIPPWLKEWLDWQMELQVSEYLPSLPPDPQGLYLGDDAGGRTKIVSALVKEYMAATGTTEGTAGPSMGVSREVIRRMLACNSTTLRLYVGTRENVLAAFARHPRLLPLARTCFAVKPGDM